MKHLLICIALLIVVAPAQAPAASEGWTGEPTLVGGTARYDDAEWIYTDFVYDDYGADTVPSGQSNVVSLAPTVGDFRYPNGTTSAGNAADIAEVRAQVAGNGADLDVRVRLQSIVDAAKPALQVTANGSTTIFTHGNAAVDADANTVSFTLPGAAAGPTAELIVGAGLHDGSGGLLAGTPGYAAANPGAFTTGAPTTARLFDLAFNTHEIEGRGGAWNENAQAAAVAAGQSFSQTIDIDALKTGVPVAEPIRRGYMVRMFESEQDLGEGMAPSFPQYRATRQPYAIWVPADYDPDEPAPLFLNLHSLSVHHNQYRGGPPASASYKTLYEQYEAGIGAIVVTPLGRGPDGWYQDEALVDTLEVWRDVRANFNIDPERTVVGGYSMGGYGTYRLTTLMPDAFASAVSIVGPPADGIWAYPGPPPGGEGMPDNTRPQLENTRHIPFWITQGVLDELVPVAGVVHQSERFRELGHEYRLAVHPAEDHLSFVYKDDWSREVAWLGAHLTRVTDPQRVTFKVRPATWATGGDPTILSQVRTLTEAVGARIDGAYWIDDVAVAPGADVTGVIDLTSLAIEREQAGLAEQVGAGTDGPSPHLLRGQDQLWTTRTATDTLTGTLSQVTALTVDLGRAALSDAPTLDVQTDTPVTITFVRGGAVIDSVQLS